MARTFLITGINRGLGRAFAQAALAAGHKVAGTARTDRDVLDFEALAPGRARGFLLDVAEHARVEPVVRAIEAEIGAIDILINNAGYGHEGILEESPLNELVDQFGVNVFGAVALIKAVLPGMRRQRHGHIINVSSLVGHVALPGVPYYAASKFAIEGISAALAKEVRDLGIHVTSLALGPFRTDWAGSSLVRTERSIADYDGIFEPIRRARRDKSGKQAGDPAKAARAVLKIIEAESPPLHLVLGEFALGLVRENAHALLDELDRWQALSLSTEYE